jgi:hypothetical protein
VVCAESEPGVAVEVLVKEQEVPPVRVGRETLVLSVAGSSAICRGKEQRREPAAQFVGHEIQRHPLGPIR